MTDGPVIYRNGRIFNGSRLLSGHALRVEKGHVTELGRDENLPRDGNVVDLGGDILSCGYVDLQVNGGGGAMFNDDPTSDTLRGIASAHWRLGTRALLPTLITDRPEVTRSAIAATIEAVQNEIPGIAGLHLEGPHLSLARKGAHDPALIRPMQDNDLETLLAAARELPLLKVTVAPESVTEAQVETLARAGVLVSLGHTDADYETCRRYFDAGARCATHLFNAMSQLGSRAPGLVGAALADGRVSVGLIADAVHVHPASMRVAWDAKTAPGGIFLVSDAMAVAGTESDRFELNGRAITRRDGVLTLEDGTLAGADLDLTTAVRNMVEKVGIPLEAALQAATRTPAAVIGRPELGSISVGAPSKTLIRISADLTSARALD